jgi:hypothetical protein
MQRGCTADERKQIGRGALRASSLKFCIHGVSYSNVTYLGLEDISSHCPGMILWWHVLVDMAGAINAGF